MKRALWILIAAAALGCGSEKKAAERYEDALRLAENGQNAEAVDALRQTLKRRPEHSAANDRLGRLYLEAGDSANAAAHLKRAAGDEAYADRHLALRHLGDALAAEGQLNEAYAALTKSIALRESGAAFYSLARVFAQANDMDGAAMALNEAVRLDPTRLADLFKDPAFQRFRASPSAADLVKEADAP
ncbi:MAG: hypothetical protein OXT69_14575 [Candidatus Poribacteria bacterium]|nr:hypothetical protein [Candidatus Poribacteria bacterium]